MRPELLTTVAVDNSASIQPARSIFISWGKSVQISGATSVKEKLAAQGFDFAPTSPPSAFSQQIRDDLAKWVPIVKASGAKVD